MSEAEFYYALHCYLFRVTGNHKRAALALKMHIRRAFAEEIKIALWFVLRPKDRQLAETALRVVGEIT